jgi:branched-chain amino acid transport system substrate-binding protein
MEREAQKMKKYWMGIGIAAAVVLVIVLIISQRRKEPNNIKIGAVLCLTGSGAPYGEDALRGIQLAVDEDNGTGGVNGKPIQLIVEDDQTNPSISVAATSKLINQDKVQVLIGAVTSSSMLADAPIAERAKVVMLSPSASNPDITRAGDYIFRNWISDTLEGKAMANYLYNEEKVRKVAVLYIKNDYGSGLRSVFEQRFKELGGQVTASESYNQDDTDFRTQLTKIKGSSPERIYMPGYYKEMALILRQAKELGLQIPFRSVVTFEEPELMKLAGAEAEGVVYSSPFYNPESSEQNVAKFVADFKKKYGRDPGIFAAHGYDGAMIIISVMRGVNPLSEDAIKAGLYNVKNYPGVSGMTSFDSNGDVVKPVAIKQVKDGKFVLLKSVSVD